MYSVLVFTDETDPIKVWQLIREKTTPDALKRNTRDYTLDIWATAVSSTEQFTTFYFRFHVRLDIDPTNRKAIKATLEVHHLRKIVGTIP